MMDALVYIRKDEVGWLVYLLLLGKMGNEMHFASHAEAFDFACAHRIDFVHQPWSAEIEARIHAVLQGVSHVLDTRS